ncbi:cytochrome P450 [Mucor mucedo]|uniref:cytochrome P450 n=1 Tax=Mucor mucedo TaxID=29922 RepID=UPI00221F9DDC|nr:cytochrome P450 [Mucor mucedo]KAI7890517.1 cytochrome P450 [Mucor mucedo]
MTTPHFGTIAALSTIAVITGLFIRYPDCALFDQHRKDIPHIKGDPLIGNLMAVSKNKNRYFEYVLEVYEALDTMTFRSSSLGIPSGISTVDPKNIDHVCRANFQNYVKSENFRHIFHDVLGEGIFNTDGESWRLQRKTSSQIFHVKNFQTAFTSIFVSHVQTLSNEILENAVNHHQAVDFHDLMLRFTMDTFVEIAFGVKLNSLLEDQDFAGSFDAIQQDHYRRIIFPLHGLMRNLQDTFTSQKTIKQHIQTLDDFIYRIIKERRLKHEKSPEMDTETYKTDLLLRFMKAKSPSGEPYSDKELRDTMLNLVIAGRDTSAQTIAWFCYSVMNHPQVQEKLLEEIEQFITDDIEQDTVALYEAIQKMKYAHAVLYEVLRLYPSVPSNRRQALNDDLLPDGTHVKKGDEVIFQPFCQGRHEKVWGPDAKQFKPERWINSEGNLVRAESGKYIVFHMGPRICLGQNMATLEVLLTMSMLLKKYKLTRVPGHRVEFLNQVTLSMKDGLQVNVERRNPVLQII